MKSLNKIIRDVPVFRHCTNDEVRYLSAIARLVQVKKGQKIDTRKVNTLNIVAEGYFQVKVYGSTNTEFIALAAGSFFGRVPFVDQDPGGLYTALSDSTIISLEKEHLYKFFLTSFKGLRGYMKAVDRIGLSASAVGKTYLGYNSRVVSVTGPEKGAGASFFSALLSSALHVHDKTIILDLTYSGNSVFNLFNKRITSPLSHKQVDNHSAEKLIRDRIEHVSDTLALMNITFGSKVKVAPDILPVLLFILSREYKYIILDVAHDDTDLKAKAFAVSDVVFPVLKTQKKIADVQADIDRYLTEGQRLFYIINEFFAGKIHAIQGALLLREYIYDRKAATAQGMAAIAESQRSDSLDKIVTYIVRKKRAVFFQPECMNAVGYAGFLLAIANHNITVDMYYSSALSYIVTALYLVAEEPGEYRRQMVKFFGPDTVNRLLEITFPSEFVFKNNAIQKLADEFTGSKRIEICESLPIARVVDQVTGRDEMVSSGLVRDCIAASYGMYPLFETSNYKNGSYHSGYPEQGARFEDLFRFDADTIVHVAIGKTEIADYDEKILPFYRRYLHQVCPNTLVNRSSTLADQNFILDITDNKFKVEKIIDNLESVSLKKLKESSL